MKNKNLFRLVLTYFAIALVAFAAAANYKIFIFPNSFVPAGLDGVCTIIQDLLHINIGYLALMLNVPLLIAAFFKLSPSFTFRSAFYIVVFSLASILLPHLGIEKILFYTGNWVSTVFAPLLAGVIRGLLYVPTLRLGATSGGVDVISALVHRKHPDFDFMNIVLCLNLTVAVCAFFAYHFRVTATLCSIVYSVLCTFMYHRFDKWIPKKENDENQ